MIIVWPFTRKPIEPTPEALEALARAEAANRQLDEKTGPLEKLVEQFRIEREENHFGPAIAEALRPRRSRRDD